MSKIKLYEKFNTRNHGIVTVLDYIDCKNVLIKFENSGATKLVRADPIVTGKDRKSTRLNSSHSAKSRMPSSA